ncbi:MAG: methyltransferase domain-containing protein [Myxococcota bacterium]
MKPSDAPRLSDDLAKRVGAWIEAASEAEPLRFPELRKGVQALSARYVERRGERGAAAGAFAGAGLRAAFASFYAPLHFLAAYHTLQALPAAFPSGVRRVVDLGAGTGAVGAALSLAAGGAPVLALDRSAWALAEARRSFRHLGVRGRTRRVELPNGLPRLGPGDLVAAGYLLNELPDPARERLASAFERALGAGARLLVLEPLARGVSPWWDDLARRLEAVRVEPALFKWRIERPAWIERLDDASGLDHREIGARILWGPPEER